MRGLCSQKPPVKAENTVLLLPKPHKKWKKSRFHGFCPPLASFRLQFFLRLNSKKLKFGGRKIGGQE